MTDRADRLLALTPLLRRHARLLTGSQSIGDEYVRMVFELVLEDPSLLGTGNLRSELFRVLHTVWRRINSDLFVTSPFDFVDPDQRLEKALQALPPLDRRALLLVTLEGFNVIEAAGILGLTATETTIAVERGRAALGRWSAVDTLIIEDEKIVAMELQGVVEDMGHHVIGHARHVDEAVAKARDAKPGLILADIELADDENGLYAAQRILQLLDVPLIFITGHAERLVTGNRPEPAFVVAKPFEPETLKAIIGHVLALYETPALAKEHRRCLQDKLVAAIGNVIPFPGQRKAGEPADPQRPSDNGSVIGRPAGNPPPSP